MKSLFFGILLIIIIGIGGLIYRNAIEHPLKTIACPLDVLMCPDGTSVSRIGTSCTFQTCQPPNVSLSDINISFALPDGFTISDTPEQGSIVTYESAKPIVPDSFTDVSNIIIRQYVIDESSSALSTIQQTAIGGASGEPVSATSFSSKMLGNHRFTVVSIERFEGVIDTAYYLARSTDVLRFDAIDRGVDWTNPNLDISKLPAHTALEKLLTTLQGQ